MKKLEVRSSEKLLIVAPHPDDETLGCGGLLAKYGKQCDVLLITDGRQGFFEHSTVTDPEKVAHIRKQELLDAAKILNVNSVKFLDLPNGNLKPYLSKIRKIDLKKYTKIFIPGSKEAHYEHVLVNRFLRKTILHQWCKTLVFEYEVWTPIQAPNYMLDISDVIDKKAEAVSVFKSQIECYDYVNLSKGINQFRGCTQFVKYAEVYRKRVMPRDWLRDMCRSIRRINNVMR